MDILSDVLKTVRLSGSVFFTADLYHPWHVSSPTKEIILQHMPRKAECVSLFHIITEGSCRFKAENGKAFVLNKDSVIIFPHCTPHKMGSSFEKSPIPVVKLLTPEHIMGRSNLVYGDSGDKCQFICGYLLCDQRFNPLIGTLPEAIVLHLGDTSTEEEGNPSPDTISIAPDSWLFTTFNQLISEVKHKNSGSAAIITRLTELMYAEVLRRYMHQLPEHSKGWLAAVRDHKIGKALRMIHNQPEKKWDTEQLAAEVGISRSAFAKRFSGLLGIPPMQYLTGWRIQLAKNLLLQPNLSMASIAEKVGYESDISFNKAFKRYVGDPPALWRNQHALS